MIDLAVIPAGGTGKRALPATASVPKPLLEVAGKSLLERNLVILRDRLGITEVIIVINEQGQQIEGAVGSGDHLDMRIRYATTPDPDGGLAAGLRAVEPMVDRPFAVILGDELYLGAHHERLRAPEGDWLCVCGTVDPVDRRQLADNYRVDLAPDGRHVQSVDEKPRDTRTGLLGTGSWLFQPEIFDHLRATAPSPRTGRVELVDAIATGIAAGRPVLAVDLGGEYVNVNTVEEHNRANDLARTAACNDATVAVVIPAFAEEEAIATTVEDFASSPLVDEVLVVDNASPDATARLARAAGARVETVQLRGYGDTITWGVDHTDADIVVVVEADHSFRAKDLGKLLEYLKDADLVVGTRTTRQLIEQGTNMHGVVRWANVFAGKLVEALWWGSEPRFTDVGCTYRAMWRDTWDRIRPQISTTGPEFSPEVMIEALRAGLRVVEVPVSYHPRLGGESKHSRGYLALARTGLRMLRVILQRSAPGRRVRRASR